MDPRIKIKLLRFSLNLILIIVLLYGIHGEIDFALTKARDINLELYGRHQGDNIIFYESCDGYVQPYYSCNGTRFENLTGKYCDKALVCQRSYKIIK